jgi:hypothetical protein
MSRWLIPRVGPPGADDLWGCCLQGAALRYQHASRNGDREIARLPSRPVRESAGPLPRSWCALGGSVIGIRSGLLRGHHGVGVMSIAGEMESDQTSQRDRRGIESNAAAGKPHSFSPYGYRRIYDPVSRRSFVSNRTGG